MNPINEEIILEIERIADESRISAKRHEVAGAPWISLNYILGIPSVLLAAGAGVTAFTLSAGTAGVMSIVVAILTAISTYLDPVKKGNAHISASKAYKSLHNDVRLVKIDCQDRSELEWRMQLRMLVEKLNQLNENSPALSERSYRIAEQKLRNNQQRNTSL